MLFSILMLTLLLTALISARNVIAAHFQGLFFLLTGNKRLGLGFYSFIFLPGVIIHELSHFFMAAFLGVRTGEIRIFPSGQTEKGNQQLGSVQIAKTDIFRGSIIGIAPLLFGSIIIIALARYQFPELLESFIHLEGAVNQLLAEGERLLAQPRNLIWLYLILAVSNTMFVSHSDRRSWPAMLFILVLLIALAVWSGAASPITEVIYQPINTTLNILNSAFLISLIIDLMIVAPIIILEKLLEKLLRKRISYTLNL